MPQPPGSHHQACPLRPDGVAELRAATAGSSIHNAVRFDAPAPCTNCWITDMVPSLVYKGDANHADGTVANLDNDAMMHHFVLINPRPHRTPVCPSGLQGQLGERFFAAGNERSQMHLPAPFGYQNSTSTWRMISHVVNKGAVAEEPQHRGRLPVPDHRRRRREAAVARHRRLRRLRVHDAGRLQRRHGGLDLDRQRPHDRHVRPPARRRHHQREPVPRPLSRRRATASRSRPSSSAATRATTTARSRRTTRRRRRSPARRCAARRATTARRGRATRYRAAISTR